jgi:2-polyprenyl-3-methyl-5-hydroxy-6-metoxy-1,4-benzoquinol methylase
MMFARRYTNEIMDDLTVPTDEIEKAFDELTTINRWLGGWRVSRLGIKHLVGGRPPDRPVTILDVGAGGSDLPEALAPLGLPCEITALDINPQAALYAQKHGRRVQTVTASAHHADFDENSFDIVHLSLFLHHCDDTEAKELLARVYRVARLGVVINDLRRNVLAYAGIALLTRCFSSSVLVRHDGPLSVLRGFTRSELIALLPGALHGNAVVTRRWAFRWEIYLKSDRSDDDSLARGCRGHRWRSRGFGRGALRRKNRPLSLFDRKTSVPA